MTGAPIDSPHAEAADAAHGPEAEAEAPEPGSEGVAAPPGALGSSRRFLRKTLPWLLAAAIFGWIFYEIPAADAWLAMQQARLDRFLPVMLAAVVLWFWIDAGAFAYLFSRFNAPLSYAEARSLRGLTYIVTPINWNLGTAAVIVHLRTSKGISALRATSSLLFYQTIDAIVLAGYVLLGAFVLPLGAETATLRQGAFLFVGLAGISLLLFMGSWPGFRWLMRMRAMELFQSHQSAVVRDVAVLLGAKTVYFLVFVGMYWFGAAAFGIEMPFAYALATTPLIMLAGSVPVTPAGLGTQQAAMLYFYSAFGDEAAVLAFGLLFPIALMLFRLLLGLVYLKDLPQLRRALERQRAASG